MLFWGPTHQGTPECASGTTGRAAPPETRRGDMGPQKEDWPPEPRTPSLGAGQAAESVNITAGAQGRWFPETKPHPLSLPCPTEGNGFGLTAIMKGGRRKDVKNMWHMFHLQHIVNLWDVSFEIEGHLIGLSPTGPCRRVLCRAFSLRGIVGRMSQQTDVDAGLASPTAWYASESGWGLGNL